MKRDNEHKRSVKNILFLSKRLQNDSTKKKVITQFKKDVNNKFSVTSFNNSSLINSNESLIKVKRKIYRSSSSISSIPNNPTIFSPCKSNSKNSVGNIYYQKNVISPIPEQRKENFKTSIMNNQIKNKHHKNILYSPSSPNTPSKSIIATNKNYSSKYNNTMNSIDNVSNRLNPSLFNPFTTPQIKFNQQMNLLSDNIYKEIGYLVKKLAEIKHNKEKDINQENMSYLKQLKELYDNKERQIIYIYDKYKYDLNNLKYRERKKYLEMYKNKAKELMEIENNFNFEKEQIKISYQMNFDLIKKREEIEIKNLFERKIIEKARNNLLNLIDF